MQQETWFYEGFRVDFQIPDGFHGFSPSRLPDRTRYVDPYGRMKYRVPHQVASFRDGDSLRVELAYALPRYNVTLMDSDRNIALENGVFLFDERWDEVYRKRSDLKLKWPRFAPSRYPAADSLRNNHLVFQVPFRLCSRHVPPGWRIEGRRARIHRHVPAAPGIRSGGVVAGDERPAAGRAN